jgi:hypothetical protein
MKGYEFGEMIARKGLAWAVCVWLAEIAGWLLRPRVLGVLVGFIAAGVWINGGVSLAGIHWPEWPQGSVAKDDAEAFNLFMKQQQWAEGYTEVALREWPGKPALKMGDFSPAVVYWVIFRGTFRETSSVVDKDGKPLQEFCLHLYAKRAVHQAGGFEAPHPYFLGFLTWPEVLVKCRWPGGRKFVPDA